MSDPRPARPPEREPLDGAFARLEPLDVARHGADLWAAVSGHNEMWRWMAYGPFANEAAFVGWLEIRAVLADPVYFAILDKAGGKALGCATLMEIRPANGVIEVGNIFFSPSLQKTSIATEAIFLLMRAVFETWGYRCFEWKCDNANEPSKSAALRFGFSFEGVFRQHMIIKGRNRDTAWFSIIDSEWPDLERAFRAWLAPENFDADGRQRSRLRALRRTPDMSQQIR